jgi:hypothetical protein
VSLSTDTNILLKGDIHKKQAKTIPCYVGPCHNGIAHPRIAGGGDVHQEWRLAVKILNKVRELPARGGPPAWGFGQELKTPHLKKKLVTKYQKRPRILMESLEQHRQQKMDMRFGT